ncbi:hypothetical protein ACHAQA_005678 [Verticillium albo-atrum]
MRYEVNSFSPDARLPLMGDVQKRLLKAFRSTGSQTPSHFAVWSLLPGFVEGLRALTKKYGVKTHNTTKALSSDAETGFRMLTLLWAIPRELIEPIITQTLQFERHENEFFTAARTHAPGIYIASIGVQGRSGKFLSRRELAKIIRHMDEYVGYAQLANKLAKRPNDARWKPVRLAKDADLEQWIDLDFLHSLPWPNDSSAYSGPANPTRLTQLLRQKLNTGIELVQSIDSQHKLAGWDLEHKGSRWVPAAEQDKGLERFRRFRAQLYRRIGGSADDDDDDEIDLDRLMVSEENKDKVWQLQAPQYAGCSNRLSDRRKDYRFGNLDNLNKHMGILSCILSHAGYTPEINWNVVLRTWSDDQLGVAEQLVCLLGQCFVWEDGYNSVECGAQRSTANPQCLSEATLDLLGGSPYIRDGLKVAVKEMIGRIDRLNEMIGIEKRVEALERGLNDLAGRVRNVDRIIQEIGGAHAPQDMRLTTKRLKQQNIRLKEACIAHEAACRWVELLLEAGGIPCTQSGPKEVVLWRPPVVDTTPDEATIEAMRLEILESCRTGPYDEIPPEDLQFVKDFLGDDSHSQDSSGSIPGAVRRDSDHSDDGPDSSQPHDSDHSDDRPDSSQPPRSDHSDGGPDSSQSHDSDNSDDDDGHGGVGSPMLRSPNFVVEIPSRRVTPSDDDEAVQSLPPTSSDPLKTSSDPIKTSSDSDYIFEGNMDITSSPPPSRATRSGKVLVKPEAGK